LEETNPAPGATPETQHIRKVAGAFGEGSVNVLIRYLRRSVVVGVIACAALFATAGIAFAGGPDGPATGDEGQFLCPAVGAGLFTADANNGDNGVGGIGTIGSGQQTFLPGNNQAGLHVNDNGLNTDNPGDTDGPGGGNSDWSPIWPGNALS
jgi:hypothetical protein